RAMRAFPVFLQNIARSIAEFTSGDLHSPRASAVAGLGWPRRVTETLQLRKQKNERPCMQIVRNSKYVRRVVEIVRDPRLAKASWGRVRSLVVSTTFGGIFGSGTTLAPKQFSPWRAGRCRPCRFPVPEASQQGNRVRRG